MIKIYIQERVPEHRLDTFLPKEKKEKRISGFFLRFKNRNLNK
jgi:hypothetical protein